MGMVNNDTGNFENLKFEVEEGIARVILNRPEVHNCLNLKTAEEIAEALKVCESDDILVIVISGEGRSFCAGADVGEFYRNLDKVRDPEFFEKFGGIFNFDLIKKMRDLLKPVIVLTKGFTFGAGLSIVLASDYAIASDDTIFFSGFIRLGLSPDIGTSYFLPRHVGMKKAFELMSFGETFGARDALEMGLVNEVVSPDKLDERGLAVAKRYLKAPKEAVARIKQLINISFENTLYEHLKIEMKHTYETMLTDDFEEGLKAVLEKREPEFK
jgi:2-(1,2-epoxy-1,2-dihydrophenyl)acetyl-CoA isomerase